MQAEFEVAATNGLFDADRCRWIATRFDTVVLSLDGPREIQELQRPALDGELFDRIEGNAQNPLPGFSRPGLAGLHLHGDGWPHGGNCRLVHHGIPARQRLFLAPLTELRFSRRFGLLPPPAMEFARNFHRASVILEHRGVKPVFSTADLTRSRISFCPVGKDALIVPPMAP